MGRMDYLAMKTDQETAQLLNSDFNELKMAAKKLINHATKLGGLGFGTSLLKWVASFAAIYLLILDRTNWKTNMLTSLLIPYIFLTLPSGLFHLLRGEVGKWIAFIAVVLRLFFPRHFPDWLEMPASLILLLVVAPNFFAHSMRELGWRCNMSCHRLLSAARAHQSVWWIPQLLHTKPWYIKHSWYYPLVGVSHLGSGSSCCLNFT